MSSGFQQPTILSTSPMSATTQRAKELQADYQKALTEQKLREKEQARQAQPVESKVSSTYLTGYTQIHDDQWVKDSDWQKILDLDKEYNTNFAEIAKSQGIDAMNKAIEAYNASHTTTTTTYTLNTGLLTYEQYRALPKETRDSQYIELRNGTTGAVSVAFFDMLMYYDTKHAQETGTIGKLVYTLQNKGLDALKTLPEYQQIEANKAQEYIKYSQDQAIVKAEVQQRALAKLTDYIDNGYIDVAKAIDEGHSADLVNAGILQAGASSSITGISSPETKISDIWWQTSKAIGINLMPRATSTCGNDGYSYHQIASYPEMSIRQAQWNKLVEYDKENGTNYAKLADEKGLRYMMSQIAKDIEAGKIKATNKIPTDILEVYRNENGTYNLEQAIRDGIPDSVLSNKFDKATIDAAKQIINNLTTNKDKLDPITQRIKSAGYLNNDGTINLVDMFEDKFLTTREGGISRQDLEKVLDKQAIDNALQFSLSNTKVKNIQGDYIYVPDSWLDEMPPDMKRDVVTNGLSVLTANTNQKLFQKYIDWGLIPNGSEYISYDGQNFKYFTAKQANEMDKKARENYLAQDASKGSMLTLEYFKWEQRNLELAYAVRAFNAVREQAERLGVAYPTINAFKNAIGKDLEPIIQEDYKKLVDESKELGIAYPTYEAFKITHPDIVAKRYAEAEASNIAYQEKINTLTHPASMLAWWSVVGEAVHEGIEKTIPISGTIAGQIGAGIAKGLIDIPLSLITIGSVAADIGIKPIQGLKEGGWSGGKEGAKESATEFNMLAEGMIGFFAGIPFYVSSKPAEAIPYLATLMLAPRVAMKVGKVFVDSFQTVKIRTRFGETKVTVWKGLNINGKPIVGMSEGKLTLGTKGVSLPDATIIRDGWNPVSKLETRVLAGENALRKMNVPEADIAKIVSTWEESVPKFARQESPAGVTPSEILSGSERLTPTEVSVILREVSKQGKDIEHVYGSSTIRPQLYAELRDWRAWHDIDIQAKLDVNGALKLRDIIMKALRKEGSKVRVSADKPLNIEKYIEAEKTWKKIIDLHTGDEIAYQTPEGAYGWTFYEKPIKINIPDVGEIEIMTLSETGLRKGASITQFRKGGISPAEYRINDIADFYVILKNFKGEAVANEWARQFGYEPKQLMKIVEENPIDIGRWKFSPKSPKAKTSLPSISPVSSVSIFIPKELKEKISPSLASAIENYSPLVFSPSVLSSVLSSINSPRIDRTSFPSATSSKASSSAIVSTTTSKTTSSKSEASSSQSQITSTPSKYSHSQYSPSPYTSSPPSKTSPPPYSPSSPSPPPSELPVVPLPSGDSKGILKIPDGSIAWKQGAFYKYIPPPWNQDKPITIKKAPEGFDLKGRTPKETIQMIGATNAQVPEEFSIDMGVTDIFVTSHGKTIKFKGKGLKTNVGRGKWSNTKGMSRGISVV